MRRKRSHLSPIEIFVSDFYLRLFKSGLSKPRLNELGLYSSQQMKKKHLSSIERDWLLNLMSTIPYYDVICARYGINTTKLTCAEYAMSKGISEKEARISYANGSKRFYQILACKLAFCNEPMLVFGHPDSKTRPAIYAEESPSLIKIFFWPKKIDCDEQVLKTVLNGLVFSGFCSGYSTDRLINGEIELFFNPAYHVKKDRTYSLERVIKVLKNNVIYMDE